VTTIGDVADETEIPPGEEVAVYEVIGDPPLFVGGEKATEILVCEEVVAIGEVGADETDAAVVLAEFETCARDRPIPFLALTENV
jgi:hypothetical protein